MVLRRLFAVLSLVSILAIAVPFSHRAATAATPVVTFVTDVGGLNDNGFNHLGWIGTQAGAKQAHWLAKSIETTSPSDYVKNLTIAAQQSTFVVAVGFSLADAVKAVAAKFPKVNFTIVDWSYPTTLKNVLGNVFTPGQSSYLAGVLAAGMSKTHTIGFVGGLNVPVIQEFLAGYTAGAKSYDPKVKVLSAYTGSFTDQSKGKITALQEINQGADIIFPAAGGSGLGSLTAAAQKGLYGIGVDADQNFLHPNSVISSVVKHVEVAVQSAIVADAAGKFKGGAILWNLANNGVGLASFHGLDSKVPAKVKAAIAAARAAIVSGKVKIVVGTK